MTIYLYALQNTKAQLCANQACFSGVDAEATAALVEKMWKDMGYIVNRTEES